jgi:hypothetical protein
LRFVETFWQAVLAVLLGGVLSLGGVALTLHHQSRLARQSDQRTLRDRKHDRLRAAYADIVSASNAHVASTWTLATMVTKARRDRQMEELMGKVLDERSSIADAHALRL